MFSRIRGFIGRHRRKFMFGGIILGGAILVRYTQRKLREWEEKEIKNMLDKMKRQQHFESIERMCNTMMLSLAKTVRKEITEVLDTEAIVNKIRNGCADKVASWNELKVLAIARSAVIIYSYAMLATLTRIQFNVIGGHVYKDTQNSDSTTTKNAIHKEYISLSVYYVLDGIKKLSLLVKDKVAEITASMSLKDNLSLRDLEQVYWSITSFISADSTRDPVKNLATYMLRLNCEQEEDAVLSKLINGTLDLLESEEVQNLTQSNVRSGFVLLIDHISEYFTGSPEVKNGTATQNGISVPGTSNQKNILWASNNESEMNYRSGNAFTFVDINKVTMPLAKIIPIISGLVPVKATPKDVPTDLIQSLVLNNELKTLGANIFEAFSF